MPGSPCNETLKWTTHERTSDLKVPPSISKTPKHAPAHTKSAADIATGLRDSADDDAKRKSDDEPNCPRGCEEIFQEITKEIPYKAAVIHRWPEPFEVHDDQGNIITAHAHYQAVSGVDMKKVKHEKECADLLIGDAAYLDHLKLTLTAPVALAYRPELANEVFARIELTEEEQSTPEGFDLAVRRIGTVDVSSES